MSDIILGVEITDKTVSRFLGSGQLEDEGTVTL